MRTWNSVSLETLGALRFHGADVVPFLQGQLSNDIALLAPERSLLAGYHNPQGRVIALMRVVQIAPGEVLAVFPRELATAVATRLAKFILRAKVKVADDSPAWRFAGLIAPEDPPSSAPLLAHALPQALHGARRLDGSLAVRVGARPARWLLISPAGASASPAPAPLAPLTDATPVTAEEWRRLSVAAGDPEVLTSTSEEFVGQMLNLDLVGAIAFDKGCYTGQEVIARAHFRGRVKRRLQRFATLAPARLHPGDSGELPDGRSFKIVSAAALADGRCEFLAVAPISAADPEARGAHPALVAQPLPLPYPLPE